MRIGRLDRRITIQSSTESQDASGQPIKTWATFKEVWAQRMDMRGNERFTANQELAVRTATFRIRWLSGINEQMRVVDAGQTWGIKGISENRRQGWAELSCEVINPGDVS